MRLYTDQVEDNRAPTPGSSTATQTGTDSAVLSRLFDPALTFMLVSQLLTLVSDVDNGVDEDEASTTFDKTVEAFEQKLSDIREGKLPIASLDENYKDQAQRGLNLPPTSLQSVAAECYQISQACLANDWGTVSSNTARRVRNLSAVAQDGVNENAVWSSVAAFTSAPAMDPSLRTALLGMTVAFTQGNEKLARRFFESAVIAAKEESDSEDQTKLLV